MYKVVLFVLGILSLVLNILLIVVFNVTDDSHLTYKTLVHNITADYVTIYIPTPSSIAIKIMLTASMFIADLGQ